MNIYMNILMYWAAALEIPISRCILCVSIYIHVCVYIYIAMDSLHGYDISRIAVFWVQCLVQCVVCYFPVP